jgi:hypothetical protein
MKVAILAGDALGGGWIQTQPLGTGVEATSQVD